MKPCVHDMGCVNYFYFKRNGDIDYACRLSQFLSSPAYQHTFWFPLPIPCLWLESNHLSYKHSRFRKITKEWRGYQAGAAASVVAQLHTLTSPLPSPVKNRLPGPAWIDLISSLANIFPLSANLNPNENENNYYRGFHSTTQKTYTWVDSSPGD